MPIRHENKDRYGADWDEFSRWVRFDRAAGRCECRGECGRPPAHLDPSDGRCRNRHGHPAWTGDADQPPLIELADQPAGAGSVMVVVLTVAHRNHIPEQRGDDEVFAACPGCHLHYDRDHHAHTRHHTHTRELAAHMDGLFPTPEGVTE